MLGSQRLSELRNAIECPADRNMASLGMAVPGAFLYLEGVFYVDSRDPTVDYAKPIIDFCQEHRIPSPPEVEDSAEAFPAQGNPVTSKSPVITFSISAI